MMFIAHRGNLYGPSLYENEPRYLTTAIQHDFKVEVDVWCVNGDLWFGHDCPDHRVQQPWLDLYAADCIFHCKNWEAMVAMQNAKQHYFWHQEDEYTLTSEGLVWVYPGRPFPKTPNFIACEPQLDILPIECLGIHGICSDYVHNLRLQEKEFLCQKK